MHINETKNNINTALEQPRLANNAYDNGNSSCSRFVPKLRQIITLDACLPQQQHVIKSFLYTQLLLGATHIRSNISPAGDT